MKKIKITLGLVVVMALFAWGDYALNGLMHPAPAPVETPANQGPGKAEVPAPVVSVFKAGETVEGYRVVSQGEESQLFGKVDLSSLRQARGLKTRLQKADAGRPALPSSPGAETDFIDVYEIRGPAGQGALTYLSVKLAFVAQRNGATETINEDGRHADNSFFMNDLNLPNAAFLVVQSQDTVVGFQYSKRDPAPYASVQKILERLTPVKQ